MARASNGSVSIQCGPNATSSVRRVLILEFNDGATEGVIEFGPLGHVYRFRQTGETHNPDGLDRRTFALEPLPADALDRLEAIIGSHIEPRWPVWTPIWQFSDNETRQAVEEQADSILAEARPAVCLIATDDPISFSHFHVVQLIAQPATRG